jgi:hypothetical protein
MFIDEFVWLPNIIEKLEIKHHVTRMRLKKYSLMFLNTGSLNQDIDQMRMYTRRVDRLTADAI